MMAARVVALVANGGRGLLGGGPWWCIKVM